MIAAFLWRGLISALLWWVLTEGNWATWGLGVLAVVLATSASLKLLPPKAGGIRLSGLLAFFGFFVWNSVLGGAQVALLALRGRQALQPGVLDLSINLPPGAPRLLLVNTLGLMPGTVGMRLEDDRLRLHVLDERLPMLAAVRAVEQRIARIFGARP